MKGEQKMRLCDKCRKELKWNEDYRLASYSANIEVDLCGECASKVLKWAATKRDEIQTVSTGFIIGRAITDDEKARIQKILEGEDE